MTKAETFKAKGYHVFHTGGGCQAWHTSIEGGYVLITDESGCDLPTEDDTEILVGVYTHDGDEVKVETWPWSLFVA